MAIQAIQSQISKLVLNHNVKIPVAKEGQVVIKVECCAINSLDWKLFSGHMQAMFPLTFPYITCLDVSGTISAVGAGVTGLVVGDKVCTVLSTSYENGDLAQYTVAIADNVSKRKRLTHCLLYVWCCIKDFWSCAWQTDWQRTETAHPWRLDGGWTVCDPTRKECRLDGHGHMQRQSNHA